MKQIQWKILLFSILLPLTVGALSALFTRKGMESFLSVNQPAFAPPNWLFPVVWTILYVMMGIASYLVYTSGQPKRTALRFYALQLLFNFLWSFFFFNLQWFLFAFIWLIALWILVFVTTILFAKISKPAGYLMIPYLLWITFAGYLAYTIYLINP